MAVDLSAIETVLNNTQVDGENASRLWQDPAGDVTLRNGDVVANLRKRLESIGFQVPVAFASGLSAADATFTVTYQGGTYYANPAEVPFTTTGTFDPSQWVLLITQGELRLSNFGAPVADWEDVTENGWYTSSVGANAPIAGDIVGFVQAKDTDNVTIVAHALDVDSEADTKSYRREKNSGVWGSWYSTYSTETEIKNLVDYKIVKNTLAELNSVTSAELAVGDYVEILDPPMVFRRTADAAPTFAKDLISSGGLRYDATQSYGPKALEYFNSSTTRVGTGNATVDTNALQAAMDSEYAVDIAGTKLQLNDTITVTKIESFLTSSFGTVRNGSGHALRSATIEVVDDALPMAFDVQTYNSRFSNFLLKCNSANNTTKGFHFRRSPVGPSDVDTDISAVTQEYGSRFVETWGRGLRVDDCELVGTSDYAINLEWDTGYTPNGQSNDEVGTAERAYFINNIRDHGCKGLLENTGSNKDNIAGILVTNVMSDLGSGFFKGVLNHSVFSNLLWHYSAVTEPWMDLHDGSKYSSVSNFQFSGFLSGDADRTPSKSVLMSPTTSKGIHGITFANGKFGISDSEALYLVGSGHADVTFDNVNFVDAARNVDSVLWASQSGGSFTSVDILLKNCTFRLDQDASAPLRILNGTSTSLTTLYRDFMTRQVGMSTTWANPSMTQITS